MFSKSTLPAPLVRRFKIYYNLSMQKLTTLLQSIVAFKSTADNPREIKKGLEYIASLFDIQKFATKILEKNGKYSLLVAFKGRDALRPRVLLNGHFDVVPAEKEEDYTLRIEGSKVYGRGTLDMKGMVAVLIEVMRELGMQEKVPDVALLLNGDEEVGGANGAGYAVKEVGMRPQFVICPDGGVAEEMEIINKEKGVLWIELIAKGKGAHGAYVWLGDNALEKLIEAIQKVTQFIGPVEADAWKTTVNVGMIETSNKIPNKVPADAKATLDIRFTEELAKTPDELVEKIQNLVPEVKVNVLEQSGFLFVEENNPMLQEFKRAIEQVVGKEVKFNHAHGAADIRYFGDVGIPGVLFGSLGGGMHAAVEWVDLESLEKQKQILLDFLQNSL